MSLLQYQEIWSAHILAHTFSLIIPFFFYFLYVSCSYKQYDFLLTGSSSYHKSQCLLSFNEYLIGSFSFIDDWWKKARAWKVCLGSRGSVRLYPMKVAKGYVPKYGPLQGWDLVWKSGNCPTTGFPFHWLDTYYSKKLGLTVLIIFFNIEYQKEWKPASRCYEKVTWPGRT